MPLTKRAISPVEVSLHRLPPNIRNNELECVTNGTLSNLVRQLSSLSRHAEDIFGELYHEAVKLEHKTNTLHGRVDRLAKKVTQLDSIHEEVSLQDLHLRKPFKSSSLIDQQSLSRQTLPTAMGECYSQGDRPPDLDKLNPYRDDNKMALKFYTDPDYFFDLWRKEMLKDAEQAKKVKHPRPRVPDLHGVRRKKPRQPHDHRQKLYADAFRSGEIIMNLPPEYQTPEVLRERAAVNPNRYTDFRPPPGMVRPGRLDVPHQPGQNGQVSSGYGSGSDVTDNAAATATHYMQYADAQTQQAVYSNHPHVSMHQRPYQPQRQQRYETERPLTSPYLATGFALNAGESETPTPSDVGEVPVSPSSSESSRSRTTGMRPTQPPPAPPPPTASPVYQVQNGDLRMRMNKMTIEELRTSPPRPPVQPPPAPSLLQSEPLISSVVGRNSPDLPPPPPPLSPDQLAQMATSTASTVTEKLPSPPPTVSGTAPPPPPPPPPLQNGTGGDQRSISSDSTISGPQGAEVQKSQSPARKVDARSDLLRAIREGIKLKKVDRQEQKERERAAVSEGHDVAAILRRRMEGVMGQSDSEEEEEWEPDDWDDD